MSWDIMIFKSDEKHRNQQPEDGAQEIPPPPMGDAGDVKAKLSQSLPDIDWTDPAWGVLDFDGGSIEFSIQKEGVIDSFMLHVHGGGDPVSIIDNLCLENGWDALDCDSGEFMNSDDASAGDRAEFQKIMDNIMGNLK